MTLRTARRQVFAGAALAVAVVLCQWGCQQAPQQTEFRRFEPVEGFPPEILAARKARDELLRTLPASRGLQPYFIVNAERRWAPGQLVRVAFHGGDVPLRRDIESAAAEWTLSGNVGLDFGYQSATGNYREWSPGDTEPAAEIRVGFDKGGYWSCVGVESLDTACAKPGTQSLNLGGFDRWRPPNWRTVVIHEFGHALGFEHEHQNPEGGCDAEFRWDDDPGYIRTQHPTYRDFIPDSSGRRPGIYTVLGGPPNNWDRPTIDGNLRRLPNSSAFLRSVFDTQSIMKYSFPDWMYRDPSRSRCRGPENPAISSLDRQGIAALYPRRPANVLTEVAKKAKNLQAGIASEAIPDPQQAVLRQQLEAVRAVNH